MAKPELLLRQWTVAAVLTLAAGTVACGAGEGRSLAMEVTEARWRGDTVVVSGTWTKGLSTPPACRLLEGRDGAVVGRFGLEGATFDGNTFSQRFVPDGRHAEASTGYHVRCSVIMDSAKTASDTVPVVSSG